MLVEEDSADLGDVGVGERAKPVTEQLLLAVPILGLLGDRKGRVVILVLGGGLARGAV